MLFAGFEERLAESRSNVLATSRRMSIACATERRLLAARDGSQVGADLSWDLRASVGAATNGDSSSVAGVLRAEDASLSTRRGVRDLPAMSDSGGARDFYAASERW
jgi:hypothetical protein